MLIAQMLGVTDRINATNAVASRLAARFDFVSDQQRLNVPDRWPPRAEVAKNFEENRGRLRGDCDDHAFAAAYALHDLGVRARVVTGVCETGLGHMVCEDEHGYVIDNRFPGRVLIWAELERIGYRSWAMNRLDFEDGGPPEWYAVKVKADGTRDYS